MKKSELHSLIHEVLNEMFDPLEGEKAPKGTTAADAQTKKQIDALSASLKKAHAAVVKVLTAKYGDKFRDLEVSIKVDSKGNPQIQVHGFSKDGQFGDLDIQFPKAKHGKDSDYVRRW